MTTVLLLGAREGGLDAALRLGLETYVISDRRPARRYRRHLAGVWVTPLSRPVEELWSELRTRFPELVGASRPSAVVALVEASVELAAGLRSRFRLPGVGSGTAHWCKDKLAMKRRARWLGLPCADFARIGQRTTATTLIQRLGLPMVLKPVDSSGGRGTVIAKTYAEVARHLQPGLMAESYVHGLEMSVESFVVDGKIRFVNPSEYVLPLWANVVPARLLDGQMEAVLALNERVIEGLEVQRGITHLELYLTPEGPVFGEVAVRPPGGYLMDLMARAYEFDPWEAVLRTELGQVVDLPQHAVRTSGVWLLHPGEGLVGRVSGAEAAVRYPGVDRVELRVQPGDVLTTRSGSGESAGAVFASGTTRDEVVRALQIARRSIVIEMRPLPTEQRRRKRRAA